MANRTPSLPDVLAGLSVALVLIPQAMAYAELAGLPPQVGLVSAALPLILAAPFVSSPYLQTGPVALTALLTLGALDGRAAAFSDEYIGLAILLALLVGLFRITLGALRLGSLAYLLSEPVLTGFTTGAAILIIASQLPRALGADTGGRGVLAGAVAVASSPGDWVVGAILFAVATAVVILGGRRLHGLFPGVLVAVIASIVLSSLVGFTGDTLGDLPGGFIDLGFSFSWSDATALAPAAAAIALVGFAEPSSIARAFAAQDRQRWDANREMFAQGIANVASAFSGGMPVGGSFSRSSITRLAGGRTAWAGAVTGLAVLVALPLAPLVGPLPRAVLAAIVIVSVYKLVNLRAIGSLFAESRAQALVACGTMLATLAFAPRVERGIFVGVALAIGVHLYRELDVVTDERVEGTTLTIAPKGVLWFATVPKIERICRTNLADDPSISTVVLDLGGVGRLDYTGAATLQQSIQTLEATNVNVHLVNIAPGARRAAGIHLHAPSNPSTTDSQDHHV